MTRAVCARCAERPSVLTAYWGDPLCSPCIEHLVRVMDERDRWPPVPWAPSEVAELDQGTSR